MRSRRPVYLDLLKIRQPLPAVVSIFHRVSGALLFLALPLVLYFFGASLSDEQSFRALQQSGGVRFMVFAVLAFYAYHLVAGLRFLLFDLHRPGLYRYARSSARMVLITALLLAVSLGVWLW